MVRDTNPGYWTEYTNLQFTKHNLIHEYLNGWFPKLGFWSGRIIYLDTHAGRGQHVQGQSGSPVVALKTFLKHAFRNRILEHSEVRFRFIEHDPENVKHLQDKIKALGPLPSRVFVDISVDDCYEQIKKLLDILAVKGKKLAPAFVFVDPYGFKVPGAVLAKLARAGRVELFINVIWRELDMALAQAQQDHHGALAATMDTVFGGNRWQQIDRNANVDVRADRVVDLLRDTYGTQWVTSVRMLGDNDVTRYILAHFTNHDDGRDLMKDCVWKVCPSGGFLARRSDNPLQTTLITPVPDLRPLEQWLTTRLKEKARRWLDLDDAIRGELWRSTHLAYVIRKLRSEGIIHASGYSGRFSKRANPLISLSET